MKQTKNKNVEVNNMKNVLEKCSICKKEFGIKQGYEINCGLLTDEEGEGKDKFLVASETHPNPLCKKCFIDLKKKLKWIKI